jgi:NitT/TauT family transport system permease protein
MLSFTALWQGLAFLFPHRVPSVPETLSFLAQTPLYLLTKHVSITLRNSVYGFLFALILAVLLAYLSIQNKLFKEIVHALNGLIQSISVLVWSIVLIIIFGILSPLPPILVVVAASFPILLSSVLGALEGVDKRLLEMAHNLGAGKRDVFLDIILPSSVPYIASGSRAALGLALRISVVAEAFGQGGGIGYMINFYYGLAVPRGVFAWALLLVLIMLALDRLLLKEVEVWAGRWKM